MEMLRHIVLVLQCWDMEMERNIKSEGHRKKDDRNNKNKIFQLQGKIEGISIY